MLVFQLWPQLEPLQLHTNAGAPLQIELVKKDAEQPAAPATQVAQATPPVKTEVRQSPERPEVKTVEKQASVQSNTTEASLSDSELPQEQASVAYTPTSTNPGAMPADVEQMILTQISYPRQARRKGWEGRATFHLDVREQKLAHLDVFHSSGYELLDRAAMRGIRAIDHLPLANGLYRLPVEFRLQ